MHKRGRYLSQWHWNMREKKNGFEAERVLVALNVFRYFDLVYQFHSSITFNNRPERGRGGASEKLEKVRVRGKGEREREKRCIIEFGRNIVICALYD